MEIFDVVRDRLKNTVELLETERPGILSRMIEESLTEFGYSSMYSISDLEKLRVGLRTCIKLLSSALDLYQEKVQMEQADDVRREYQDRIKFFQEKKKQFEEELKNLELRLNVSDVKIPVFKIEKADADDES